VFTADAAMPEAQGIAIRGDRIVAVGSSGEVRRLAGASTRVVDLGGRRVIPGINDAHFHFTPLPEGVQLQFPTMEPTWAETVEALRQAVPDTPEGGWILAQIGIKALSEPSADRFALDRIAPRHPVLLATYFGHGYIVNSRAMPLLGLAEDEADPLGGRFERVGNTPRINGRLWEYAEWTPLRRLADQVPDAAVITQLRALADEAVRLGITSMQVMSSMPVDRFAKLLEEAGLPVRIRAIPFPLTAPQGRELSELQMLRGPDDPSALVNVSGIKWVLDGTPSERGAALREAYRDQPGWRGRLNFPEAEIVAMLRESLQHQQQILFHCAGDRCAQAVLDAMQEAGGGEVDWTQRRVRIEHGDGVSGDLVERARAAGIVVVQNPTHFTLTDIVPVRYSPDTPFFHARTLIEAGIPFALGSDGSINPYLNIMLATLHPLRPEEALTREQALTAYTAGSAYAEFAEQEKGSLAVGRLADLAVLSQDILDVPAEGLPGTQSVMTIVGGRVVHDGGVVRALH
jgi:predicted amidohydrolase YtcJ